MAPVDHENGCPRSLVRRGGGTWDIPNPQPTNTLADLPTR
jgi:hypothetical protein